MHPDVAEQILDRYWHKDGEIPSIYTINLSCRFVALAHEVGAFDEDMGPSLVVRLNHIVPLCRGVGAEFSYQAATTGRSHLNGSHH